MLTFQNHHLTLSQSNKNYGELKIYVFWKLLSSGYLKRIKIHIKNPLHIFIMMQSNKTCDIRDSILISRYSNFPRWYQKLSLSLFVIDLRIKWISHAPVVRSHALRQKHAERISAYCFQLQSQAKGKGLWYWYIIPWAERRWRRVSECVDSERPFRPPYLPLS
jgi:hypothetical protein